VKGFARCEYFGCGAGAVVAIKLDGIASDGRGHEEEVSLVLHYCAPCYEIVAENERRSEAAFAELTEQGCSTKMANHVMLARMGSNDPKA